MGLEGCPSHVVDADKNLMVVVSIGGTETRMRMKCMDDDEVNPEGLKKNREF